MMKIALMVIMAAAALNVALATPLGPQLFTGDLEENDLPPVSRGSINRLRYYKAKPAVTQAPVITQESGAPQMSMLGLIDVHVFNATMLRNYKACHFCCNCCHMAGCGVCCDF